MKNKNYPLTLEEIYEQSKSRDIKFLRKDFQKTGQAPNERKVFSIGESVYVSHGGFISAKVIDILEEGIYELEIIYKTTESYYGNNVTSPIKSIFGWYDIFKLAFNNHDTRIREDQKLEFMQQTTNSSIVTYAIRFDVAFNPSHQKQLTWSLVEEQMFIGSVFNKATVGKFIFLNLGNLPERTYEILDGRKRLTALYRFYTDQFTYEGYYYSELPWALKHFLKSTTYLRNIENRFKDL